MAANKNTQETHRKQQRQQKGNHKEAKRKHTHEAKRKQMYSNIISTYIMIHAMYTE